MIAWTQMPVEVSAAECAELLRQVLESRELKRASRLRDLLHYLGTKRCEGVTTLREQEVGAAVFGRPAEYDTSLDNIVRVTVSELRKRLAHYFAEEGATDAVMIEIPRGGYLPIFVRRPVEMVALPVAEPVVPETVAGEPVEATGGRPGLLLTALAVLVLLAGAACAVLQWQNHELKAQLRPWTADPVVEAFWGQFFGSGQEVDIVTADASYALEQDVLQRSISLDDYLDYKYESLPDGPNIDPQTRATVAQLLNRNNGSIGDFHVAERILKLGGDAAELRLTSARSYTPESIRRNDIILVGGQASNPWVELFKDRMDFYPEYDPVQHLSYVSNRTPQAGEQAAYTAAAARSRGYSVVAFLPSRSEGGGDRRVALVIAGTDSQATRAAGEFITSQEGIAAIRQRLPAGRNPYFEVLLSSSRLGGTTLHTEIVAVRGHER